MGPVKSAMQKERTFTKRKTIIEPETGKKISTQEFLGKRERQQVAPQEGMGTAITRAEAKPEKFDAGAFIGGLFIWIPFLWIMKYKPTHTYELEKERQEVE